MKKIRWVLCLLSVMFPFYQAHSTDLGFALGHSADKTTTYRFSVQEPWDINWFESETGYLTGHWTGAYTYWESQNSVNTHSFSASPVLTYEFGQPNGDIVPFVEAGIGLMWFNRNKVEDRNLGSKTNLEDRIGVGVRLYEQHTIGIQALHYSNAGTNSNNAGIESYNLYYRYHF